jgi:hypothetical protein
MVDGEMSTKRYTDEDIGRSDRSRSVGSTLPRGF